MNKDFLKIQKFINSDLKKHYFSIFTIKQSGISYLISTNLMNRIVILNETKQKDVFQIFQKLIPNFQKYGKIENNVLTLRLNTGIQEPINVMITKNGNEIPINTLNKIYYQL